MEVLISQIVTTLLTAFISIIALNKDLRSRTKKLQKEARIIKMVIYFVTTTSLANSAFSYWNSKKDLKESQKEKMSLNKKLTTIQKENGIIKKQNTNLRSELSISSIAQSRLIIASQQKSALQLTKAASNLSNSINGSDQPPVFTFVFNSKLHPSGTVKNRDSIPILGFSYRITNFTNFEKCSLRYSKIYKANVINEGCVLAETVELGYESVMAASSYKDFALPNDNFLSKGKYYLTITLKKKVYCEQAIYKVVNSGFIQATRIVLFSKDFKHITRSWIVKKDDEDFSGILNVDWEKEFPAKYFENIKMRYY